MDFGFAITVTDGSTASASIYLFSPGELQWVPCDVGTQAGAAGILVHEAANDTDCNAVLITPEITGIISALPLPTVSPTYTF